MSSEQEYNPTGYHDDENRTVRTSVDEQVTIKKKKTSWLPIIIFGVLLLAAAGVGASFLMKKPAQPAPKPAPAIEAPADSADGENPLGDSSADPNAAGAGEDPLAAGDQQAIDPATGLPVAQAPAQPAQPAIDPATGLPLAQAPAGVSVTQTTTAPPGAVVNTQVTQVPGIDPATGLPVAQTQVTQTTAPVVDPMAQAPVETPSEPVLDPNDPLSAFRNLLAPVEVRVSKLEKKFTTLEKTVQNIQSYVGMKGGKSGKSGNSRSAHASSRPKATPKKNSRSTVKIENSQSQVYVEGPARAPVSRVIIDQRPYNGNGGGERYDDRGSYSAAPAERNSGSCNAQAIVQGRVWVKRPDGSFVSYGEGDTWSNGGVIQSIDPSRGIQVNGRWLCM